MLENCADVPRAEPHFPADNADPCTFTSLLGCQQLKERIDGNGEPVGWRTKRNFHFWKRLRHLLAAFQHLVLQRTVND